MFHSGNEDSFAHREETQQVGTVLGQFFEKAKMTGLLDIQFRNNSSYLEDGNLAIDNNAAERALGAVAVGRKNWLFAGNDEGGERAAVLYSLVASCKQKGVEPFQYLGDILERVSSHPARAVEELMPSKWKWCGRGNSS